ncbi:FAD-dependent oxidoreductase [Novosphingobium beihaiensis]|uniref:FAD-dependent oxidoreductase n=1 Tax=Novosphingobium beihaiensis TaxID=2930389 RepID=A0ABT0BVA4_9SPHN|nr:FAD-dependent oxidoreductase [Novosphingobium beihaiensis]MCJ2188998.1 FAD-dependent oxidoreductase [Novosphingobium beihaiensis]
MTMRNTMEYSRPAKGNACLPGAAASTGGEEEAEVDVAVLGAGVVGVCTAYALARRGLSVAIVERREEPGLGTSHANGAQLSYAYADALAQPSLWRKMPGMLAGLDPSFRLHLSPDPGFLRWGLAFLRNCTKKRFAEKTRAALQLGLESQAAMARLRARHPFPFAHACPGKMHIFRDAATLARASETAAIKRDAGFEQHVLGAAEACAIEPALADAGDFAGALWSPAEEVGDPYLFCRGLLDVLLRDYDVQAHFGFTAGAPLHAGDSIVIPQAATRTDERRNRRIVARKLVVCLGIDAPGYLAPLGIRAPVQPMKGYSFTAPPGGHAPQVSLTDTARKIVFCRLGGKMRIAGLAELGVRDLRVDPARLHTLIEAARTAMPRAARYGEAEDGWAGLRPMSPDSVPIVRRAAGNVFLNIGHGMLGWTLAAGSGERVAELVTACDPTMSRKD